MESVRNKKLLYHLTSVQNLPDILRGGLKSRRELNGSSARFADVADASILLGRAGHGLDGYVPFHFLPRSPFDYAVIKSHPGSQFVLIAVTRVTAQAKGWSIIPQHPLTNGDAPEIHAWQDGFNAIAWEEMDKYPRNYETDHRCKMVCMAEALSPTAVLPQSFQAIYVATEATREFVARLVAGAGLSLYINVSPGMFPQGAQ